LNWPGKFWWIENDLHGYGISTRVGGSFGPLGVFGRAAIIAPTGLPGTRGVAAFTTA
jgi:hypothetical protein